MVDSHEPRRSLWPDASQRPLPVEAGNSEPPSSAFNGDDFLFHLSRGSELLREDHVESAKEELERALRLQPRDPRGQGLLGVVYFRLGLYPRAIDIFEQLVREAPGATTPRINLSLCYLKTGQLMAARELLEEITVREPGHRRGWGYLGLVYERQGDLHKAESAYERAEQPVAIRRMKEAAEHRHSSSPLYVHASAHEVRAAAGEAFSEIEQGTLPFELARSAEVDSPSPSGRWWALEPGGSLGAPPVPQLEELQPITEHDDVLPVAVPSQRDARSSVPPPTVERFSVPVDSWAHRLRAPDGCVHFARPLLTLPLDEQGYALRGRQLVGLAPAKLRHGQQRLTRRTDPNSDCPLGGLTDPLFGLPGPGSAVLRCDDATSPRCLALNYGTFTVCEDALLAFSLGLEWKNTVLLGEQGEPVSFVTFTGLGHLVLRLSVEPTVLPVAEDRSLARVDTLLGWLGDLEPELLDAGESPLRRPGYVVFGRQGNLLLR